MIIMTRQCVVNKNHIARLKGKVTVRTYTLCIDLVGIENYLAQNGYHYKRMCPNKNHVATLKVKVTVCT